MIPLEEQDRARWDREAIAEAVAVVTGALARAPIGPYQVQAAIAAVHARAAYQRAANRTTSLPERRHLEGRASRCRGPAPPLRTSGR